MSYIVLAAGIVLILLVFSSSLKTAKEQERLVCFRLGRYMGIRGPGIVFLAPFIDSVVRVDLDVSIPNWKSLSDEELEAKIRSIVLDGQK